MAISKIIRDELVAEMNEIGTLISKLEDTWQKDVSAKTSKLDGDDMDEAIGHLRSALEALRRAEVL
jgi:hypothetical protein